MIQLEDKLYTSTEVANILGVSLRSVYRYLEENKINAEVKTATGRHRFSKKNILDFLYPDGSEIQKPIQVAAVEPKTMPVKKVLVKEVKEKIEEKPVMEEATVTEAEVEPKVEPEPKVEEEPIDWLAKFREAARKYREEAEKTQEDKPVEASKKTDTFSMTENVTIKEEPAFVQDISSDEKEVIKKITYRSNLGGLKDIAQNIDKGARSSYLDYAFTLNAGLSLYKPIKPFSMLHAYVRPGDLSFFEKLLGLTPTDESNSQLCLIVSDEDSVYKKKDELHGLFVVSKERLLSDVREMGDSSLVAESSTILK